MKQGIASIELEGLKKFKSGKVRDIYDLGDNLLFVASDRISAFDYILPNPVPDKGKILTQLSLFWFDFTKDIVKNHVVTASVDEYPDEVKKYRDIIDARSMIGKKAEVVEVECVVRGYLAGSGWKDYKRTRAICGIKLPDNLLEAAELEQPIFTPATKARTGHDENISIEKVKDMVGSEITEQLIEKSIALYNRTRDYAKSRGIILSDTKFEFGFLEGELILIDEILTPDSSRFWPADKYEPGHPQVSFDKQFVRDYLESIKWDKKPPVPELPDEVIEKTREKYLEAYMRLTGKNLLQKST